jgi:hypothetical protein
LRVTIVQLRERPLFTDVLSSVDQFHPDRNSVYVYATSGEARSAHLDVWRSSAAAPTLAAITEISRTDITCQIGSEAPRKFALRSRRQMADLCAALPSQTFYIDITGMPHHVWAPLVRAGIRSGKRLMAVYVEPGEYAVSIAPTEGEIFDLSERIEGVAPIPGFISLADRSDEETCFVALLGFEGTRFAHILEMVQPLAAKVVPIIGVPGFRAEYPFHTYHGNRLSLSATQAWRRVRFAAANDPFSLYYELEAISANYPAHQMKIAPIGTKPHALGAVLFAIRHADFVELVYDHPVRKPTRTSGVDRLLVYHLSEFGSV